MQFCLARHKAIFMQKISPLALKMMEPFEVTDRRMDKNLIPLQNFYYWFFLNFFSSFSKMKFQINAWDNLWKFIQHLKCETWTFKPQ